MTELASFIKFLDERKLLEFDILGDSDKHFLNRFKIQKYVFLASFFGLDFPYNHIIYLRGPYSKTLTSEYYTLAKNMTTYESAEPTCNDEFRSEEFLNLVNGKDERWLEIATTLLDLKPDFTKPTDLIYKVGEIKTGYSKEYITRIFSDLKNHNLL